MWNPWSKESDANLEDSVRKLLFFSIEGFCLPSFITLALYLGFKVKSYYTNYQFLCCNDVDINVLDIIIFLLHIFIATFEKVEN